MKAFSWQKIFFSASEQSVRLSAAPSYKALGRELRKACIDEFSARNRKTRNRFSEAFVFECWRFTYVVRIIKAKDAMKTKDVEAKSNLVQKFDSGLSDISHWRRSKAHLLCVTGTGVQNNIYDTSSWQRIPASYYHNIVISVLHEFTRFIVTQQENIS